MDKSILNRIEDLERHRPHGITVLARDLETGKQRQMPMRELIEKFGGWGLVKVLDGNDLKELDEYLATAKGYFVRCDT